MKKHFLTLICMAIFAISLSAQKLPKSVKDAKKALNAGSYSEALQLIDAALEDGTTAGIAEAWAVKGDILNASLFNERSEILKSAIPGAQPYVIKNPAAGQGAYDAYSNALEKSVDDKDKGKKAALKGMVDLATNLNEIGLQLFNNKRFEEAYSAFSTILNAKSALEGIGNKSILSKDEDFHLMQYYTGLAAQYAGSPEKATDIYQQLVDIGYAKPLPYEQLFESLLETDEDAAFAVLEKGKKACSDDPKNLIGFLYKEINFYLKKQEYDKLEIKLQDAIAQDPENPTLYYALGNVYGSLSEKAFKAGDAEMGAKHFAEAESYYNQTMEVDPKHFDASYNIGALYYNKATLLNEPLKALGSDMSSSGMKKYDTYKEQQKNMLNASKPHFEKALAINPKHIQSMEALKGVAAYNNDIAQMKKYEEMIEAAQN